MQKFLDHLLYNRSPLIICYGDPGIAHVSSISLSVSFLYHFSCK